MTVISVMSGLLQLANSSSATIRTSTVLQNVGMEAPQASQWGSPKGTLRELRDLFGHYATGGDDEMSRAILRYASGDRSFTTRFQIGSPTNLETQLQGLGVTEPVAESLARLVTAVDAAQPRMIQVRPTRYVRGRDFEGGIEWGHLPYDYQFAERPVSHRQFLPLAEAVGFPLPTKPDALITMDDPIVNVPNGLIDNWIAMLRLFTNTNYRLPTESEWERATAMGHPLVNLNKEARTRRKTVGDMIESDWGQRYANGYVGERNGLGIGGEILHDAAVIQRLLRDGLTVSAWDFARKDEEVKENEKVYEMLTQGDLQTPHQTHVGLKYFTHRKALRKKSKAFLGEENLVFRLAVGAAPAIKPRPPK